MSQLGGYGGRLLRKRPELLVAPYGSKGHRYADLPCTGTSDDAKINEALESVATGGIVQLGSGGQDFDLRAPIYHNKPATLLRGHTGGTRANEVNQNAPGTRLLVNAAFMGSYAIIVADGANSRSLQNPMMADFSLDMADTSGIKGIQIRGREGRFCRVSIYRPADIGFDLEGYSNGDMQNNRLVDCAVRKGTGSAACIRHGPHSSDTRWRGLIVGTNPTKPAFFFDGGGAGTRIDAGTNLYDNLNNFVLGGPNGGISYLEIANSSINNSYEDNVVMNSSDTAAIYRIGFTGCEMRNHGLSGAGFSIFKFTGDTANQISEIRINNCIIVKGNNGSSDPTYLFARTGDASLSVKEIYVTDCYVDPTSEFTGSAHLSNVTLANLLYFQNNANLKNTDSVNQQNVRIKQTVVDGAAAGDVTVTGIRSYDQLVGVVMIASGVPSDLTSEFSIPASTTNKINNSGGTSTAGNKLIVTYQDNTP